MHLNDYKHNYNVTVYIYICLEISINENHFHLICGIDFSSRFSIFQLDPFGVGAKVSPPQSAASRPAGEKLVPFFWWCEMQTWLVVSHIFYILFLWRWWNNLTDVFFRWVVQPPTRDPFGWFYADRFCSGTGSGWWESGTKTKMGCCLLVVNRLRYPWLESDQCQRHKHLGTSCGRVAQKTTNCR